MSARPFVPSNYGAEFEALLAHERLAPLDAGTPHEAVHARLAALTVEKAFAPHAVADADMARCCLAGMWLYHDFLDQAHELVQYVHTPTGSYWHAILHRREPDAANAAYWFERVGAHPVLALLAREAADLGHRAGASGWDPLTFIDQCERHRGTGSEQELLLRRVQQKEWELLFDWCFQRGRREG